MNGVLLFAKAPVVGRVKTRLIPSLGPEKSLALHESLVKGCLQRLSALKESGYKLEIYSDDVENCQVQDWSKAFNLHCYAQRGTELGERMRNAFTEALGRYSAVALCGSDSFELDDGHVLRLFKQLENADLAILPAHDGGYLAIAVKNLAVAESVLKGINWGSPEVLAQTLKAATSANWQVALLPAIADIDRAADLVNTPYESWLSPA